MRSIKTEGAGGFAAQTFGAEHGETLAILETHDEAAEADPAALWRVMRAGRVAIGNEAVAA